MIAVYLLSVILANVIATWTGPLGSVLVAALLIGLDMHARDTLHARWGLSLRLFGLIAVGGALSLPFGTGRVALASCVAFVAASVVDAIAFSILVKNRAHRSNLISAPVDSVVFVGLAFGVEAIGVYAVAQTGAKIAGGYVWGRVLDWERKGRVRD